MNKSVFERSIVIINLLFIFSSLTFTCAFSKSRSYTTHLLQQESIHPHYNVSIKYPLFTHGYQFSTINDLIKNRVHQHMLRINQSFRRYTRQGFSSDFFADYDVSYAANGLYSLIWLENTFYAGAAHPNEQYKTLNYNTKLHRMMNLNDIMKTSSAFYGRLSSLCRQSLREQFKQKKITNFDRQWFDSGTSSVQSNYRIWTFSSKGLQFYFPEYSITAYCDGSFMVTIPWAKLRPFITQSFSHVVLT